MAEKRLASSKKITLTPSNTRGQILWFATIQTFKDSSIMD